MNSAILRELSGCGGFRRDNITNIMITALKQSEYKCGNKEPIMMGIMARIGFLQEEMCQYEDAEDMFSELCSVCPRIYGENHVKTVASLSELALVLRKQGKDNQAERVEKGMRDILHNLAGFKEEDAPKKEQPDWYNFSPVHKSENDSEDTSTKKTAPDTTCVRNPYFRPGFKAKNTSKPPFKYTLNEPDTEDSFYRRLKEDTFFFEPSEETQDDNLAPDEHHDSSLGKPVTPADFFKLNKLNFEQAKRNRELQESKKKQPASDDTPDPEEKGDTSSGTLTVYNKDAITDQDSFREYIDDLMKRKKPQKESTDSACTEGQAPDNTPESVEECDSKTSGSKKVSRHPAVVKFDKERENPNPFASSFDRDGKLRHQLWS